MARPEKISSKVVNVVNVLIVDDDPMSRDLIGMLVGAEGFSVKSAESGEAALKQLKRDAAVDVVLTDLQMPGLSGAELAKQLRAACGKGTMLLAMSATGPKKAVLAGFDGFLLKPFDGAAFSALVQGTKSTQGTKAKSGAGQATVDLDRVVYGKMAECMGPEQLKEIYAACLEDSRRRIEKMRTMNAKGQEDAFRAEAHAIKGACSMLGAARLAEIAAGLETSMGGGYSVDATLNEFLHQCDVLEGILLSGEM